MDKISCRRECFARIKSLTREEKSAASAQIRGFITQSALFREAKTIFSYVALAGEPDLSPLMTEHPEKTWAFPKVELDGRLSFYTRQPGDALSLGTLGIAEPVATPSRLLGPDAPDLILVPGVGFDPVTRTRIGRGKGHYDRYLALALGGSKRPAIVGISFAIQLLPLQGEAHDIPMDEIVTEAGWAG